MANFQHGHTFTEHEVRDPDAFNANVDSASLNNVGNADLTAGVRLPTIVQPGSPITGEAWVNDAQDVTFFGQKTAHPFQFFYSGIWNDQEADLYFETLQNNSAVNLMAGAVVVPDPASAGGFLIPTTLNDPKTKPLGVLLDDIAAGASGRVAQYGVVLVNLSGVVSPQEAGNLIMLIDGTGGFYVQNTAISATPLIGNEHDNIFGILLADAVSNQAWAFIWK